MNEATIIKKLLIEDTLHAIVMLKLEAEHLPALDSFLQSVEKPKEKSNVLTIQVAEEVKGRSKFG